MKILNIKVESLGDSLARAAHVMESLEQGKKIKPQQVVGFNDVFSMSSVFTQKRWELITTLRDSGPMKISNLAKKLSRNYKNIHDDVALLMQWGIIEKDALNNVVMPFDELMFDVKLSERKAA